MAIKQVANKNAKTVAFLAAVAVIMFAFGYGLVPLYNLICDITGINGKVDSVAYKLQEEISIDKTRDIDMQFVVIKNNDMPWYFAPSDTSINLHPGQTQTIEYTAYNNTSKDMIAQMIPSVSPGEVAEYIHKVECFCFDSQPLKANESKKFAVKLFIDPELPKHIEQITLAYTLFDISDRK